jgi:DmsE family decaheme c-type cytochrome
VTHGDPLHWTGSNQNWNYMCADCHSTNLRRNYDLASNSYKTTWSEINVSCETCHGPGSLHAEANGDRKSPGFGTIRNFATMKPDQANATCLGCHQGGDHFYWKQSAHSRKGVSCVTCHSMHSPKDASHTKMLKAETTTALCITCHKANHFALGKSSHMPVGEGGMTCADCHSPHGTAGPKQLRALTTNELCLTCHADKRGPFLWEHAPVRENCLNCHDAHGTNNDKALAAKRPFLCQRCHVGTRHPSTLYDLPDLTGSANNRSLNRSCTNCHSQIHGSNHSSGRYLTR